MTIRRMTTLALFGTSAMFASECFGQQETPPPRPGTQVVGQEQNGRIPGQQQPGIQQQTNFRGAMQAPVTEHQLASCLAITNQEEVAIAKFASERTKCDDVKEFAKMLVSDHQAFLKKLQPFAPEATREGYLDNTGTGQSTGKQAHRQNQQTAPQQQSGQTGQASAPVDAVQLHREVAEQCIADARKKMSEIDGDKFDICFIGHQIAKHEAMKTHLTVLERHTSGEFAQLLAEGSQATEKHLKQAIKIMEKLDADRDDDKDDKDDKSGRKSDNKSNRRAEKSEKSDK